MHVPFFPAKPLGCYGDGGMCFTQDADLASKMRSLRVHGQGSDKYDNVRIGVNGRLDTMQAAILLSKFALFPEEVEKRQQVADRYTQAVNASGRFTAPKVPHGLASAWAQYTLLTPQAGQRDAVCAHLKEHGVPTAVYYPKPLHQQTAFQYLGYGGRRFSGERRLCGPGVLPAHASLPGGPGPG